jgi:hypothetical protein
MSEPLLGEVPESPEPFDYREQLALALNATRVFWTLSQTVDYAEILRRMETAHSVGPFIDPTLWRNAARGIKSQKRLLEAARAFKAALEQQLAEETGDG